MMKLDNDDVDYFECKNLCKRYLKDVKNYLA